MSGALFYKRCIHFSYSLSIRYSLNPKKERADVIINPMLFNLLIPRP